MSSLYYRSKEQEFYINTFNYIKDKKITWAHWINKYFIPEELEDENLGLMRGKLYSYDSLGYKESIEQFSIGRGLVPSEWSYYNGPELGRFSMTNHSDFIAEVKGKRIRWKSWGADQYFIPNGYYDASDNSFCGTEYSNALLSRGIKSQETKFDISNGLDPDSWTIIEENSKVMNYIKTFIRKHKDILIVALVIILVDHFVLKGSLRTRVISFINKIFDKFSGGLNL